jgi:hypothetical protein
VDFIGLIRWLRVLIESRGTADDVAPDCSGWEGSRSFVGSETWDFCLAALTRALDRMGLLSEKVADWWSWLCGALGALELLVAS